MFSIQARILFGLFFVALAGSGLLIWMILAFGNGFFAMLAPLMVGALLSFLVWQSLNKL